MSDTKKVLRKLLQDHVGKHNGITQSKLANALDMNTSSLRSELRRLREEQNIPIGNLRSGYFVIQDKDELSEYVAHINGEIQSKRDTIEYTLEAWEGFDQEEIEVEPESEVIEQTYPCSECGEETPKSEVYYPDDEPMCKTCHGKQLMNQS